MAQPTSPLTADDLAQFESLDQSTAQQQQQQQQYQATAASTAHQQPQSGTNPFGLAQVPPSQSVQSSTNPFGLAELPPSDSAQSVANNPLLQLQQPSYAQAQQQQQQPAYQTESQGGGMQPAYGQPYNPFLSGPSAPASDSQTQAQALQADPSPFVTSTADQGQHGGSASSNPFRAAQPAEYAAGPNSTSVPAAAGAAGTTGFSADPTGAAAATTARSGLPAQQPPPQEPKAWATKDIIFRGIDRKIILQNENGPCSLLAIANILLLRGDVELQPPDRPLVDYNYLSSLIAEYLLTTPASSQEGALERALSLLPHTQYGLNLNPSFLANDTFYTAESESHQLALFELLGVQLYHGLVPDQSSPQIYSLLTAVGSYDAALDVVVRGDATASAFFTQVLGEPSVSAPLKELQSRGGYSLVESTGWGSASERDSLHKALELSSFIDGNPSQLTYPGLFALSSLPEGSLAALFRFNHLSVFYRPTASDVTASSSSVSGSVPPLLTLITDEAFLDEPLAVWESLADVDGSASGEIFDGKFRKRVIDQQRRRGRRDAGSRQDTGSGVGAAGGLAGQSEDADYALALQLHSEEADRARRSDNRRQQRHGPQGRDSDAVQGGQQGRSGDSRKSIFGGLGRNKKSNNQGRGTTTNGPSDDSSAQPAAASSSSNGAYNAAQDDELNQASQGAAEDFGGRQSGGKKKDKCVVM